MYENWQSKLDAQNLDQEAWPDIDEIITWEREGGCYTPCGCWVEPDGHCEHGIPSWMLIEELI